jgi:hypothetical protein
MTRVDDISIDQTYRPSMIRLEQTAAAGHAYSQFRLTEEVPEFSIDGFMKVFKARNIKWVNSRGICVASDKHVSSFIDEFIRFYLHEEPIIPSVPTHLFVDLRTGAPLYDKMSEVFQNLSRYVVKRVDGRGGKEVLVGKFAKREDITKFRMDVQQAPEFFIYQPFIPFPILNGLMVDARTQYLNTGLRGSVAPMVTSRSAEIEKGKTNITGGAGAYLPTFISLDCPQLLEKRQD